ncbi:MAG TPA: hypothetical protein VFG23_15255 [Polyangia bacterium]|nr:hypothetical protein [Polyangia bacterium]
MPPVTSGWENFFVAEAGASAALTGLLFVAVSINLQRILSFPQLPGRAAETLAVLASVLAVALFGLTPGQGTVAFGAELLGTALVVSALSTWVQVRGYRSGQPRSWIVSRIVAAQVPSLGYAVAGAALLAGARGGIYALVPGTLFCFTGGIVNAWVLLVEILR